MIHVSRNLWTTALVVSLGLFCTIRDDNGNPAAPGIDEPEIPQVDPEIVPSLTATPDSAYIFPGDTLGIRVRAFGDTAGNDSLVPLSAYSVTAQTSHGDHGEIIDDSLLTDSNGRALFLYTSDETGSVVLTVATNDVEQTVRFEVTETPVHVEKLLQALPGASIIKADGVDTTTISVSVLNSFRNPVVGECVQFITSAGTIIGDGGACANSGQSITGSDGIARARLRSSNVNDTAYITTYLVSDQSLSDEIDVAFQGMTINLSLSDANLKEGDTALLVATLLNASNRAVAKSPIFFSLEDGSSSNLSIVSTDEETNFEGVATARIMADDNGSDVIMVTAAGTRTSIQLNVSSLSLALEIDKTILQTSLTDTTHIKATFTNASGNPLSNRTIRMKRQFKSSNGSDTTDETSKKTNSHGECTFPVVALKWEGTMRLNLTGYDNTNGGYASADTTLQFITTRVMTIRPPQPILADGVSKAPVEVFIKNKSGNPIIGDFISFTTTAGTITAESETDENGRAIAYLTSDRRNITATVVATLVSDMSMTQSTEIAFKGVEITAAANPPSIRSNGDDTTTILLSLVDAAKIPIVGERFNISKQKEETTITITDTVTDNNGEARCKITGTGSGRDTLQVSAAGAMTSVIINYSSNILVIKTAPNQAVVADSSDSTLFIVTYLEGDRRTPIPNATVDLSATVGTMGEIFAQTFTSDADGEVTFYLRNPHFAVTATIFGLARSGDEITTGSLDVYFKANIVRKINISGTPEVITINGGRAKIEAIAFDSLDNRVKDARISFNLVNGPSGGEYLDPPVSITGDDGKAYTYLVSGKTPSMHRQVWITAGTFSSVKSDTVKFTIAGPPHYINIGTNVIKGENPNDGTFLLPCAAIVTDVNNNPVADGTEVTFSLKVSGYVTYHLYANWSDDFANTDWYCYWYVDTTIEVLPFEDFNDNYHLDPGEDRNRDGVANRGEDINGDGKFTAGPAFEDINQDGRRQYNIYSPIETRRTCGNELWFADINANSAWDPIEPLANPEYLAAYTRLQNDSCLWYNTLYDAQDSTDFATITRLDSLYRAQGEAQGGYDIDAWPYNGIADPQTAVSITRTVTTKGGKALNKILYGQSDANRIEVMIWAESQGVVTETPEKIILPIISD